MLGDVFHHIQVGSPLVSGLSSMCVIIFSRKQWCWIIKPVMWPPWVQDTLRPGVGQMWDVRSSLFHCFLNIFFKTDSFTAFGCSQVQMMFLYDGTDCTLLGCCSGRSVTGRVTLSSFRMVWPSQSICLVDIVDGQLEGCGREGLWHRVACVSPICCSRHRCILLQSGQSCCVGSVVCDGDISSSIQATTCWDTLYAVGHGIDRSDWTALENARKRQGEVKWIR